MSNKFKSFNCESTSELAKREHCKQASEEIERLVNIWLKDKKNKIQVIPWGVRSQP